ncbi:hypothetical protein [Novosphingobium lentum]|uniref:hypothetical protein n=1 Tax=Novosphingobium lentum TaxID=145287 RepID=UPI00082C3CF0|nr:hypothetical protein [Novosphingobium lentum]
MSGLLMRGCAKRSLRPALAAVALALGVGSSVAAIAQAVVVRSTGPSAASFPTGKRFADGSSVTLRANDIVTVLDRAGTRVLRGAGTFKLDNAVVRDRGTAAMLARSLSNPSSVRAGAVRGGGLPDDNAEPIPGSIWLADIDKGGRVCVPKGSDLYLWRSNSAERRFSWLGADDGGQMVRLQWPRKTAGVSWPAVMVPLSPGHSYKMTEDTDPTKAVEFEIVTLDPAKLPADAAGLGAVLLDNGCRTQFDWLASSLERIDASAPETHAAG